MPFREMLRLFLLAPGASLPFARFTHGCAVILQLHRFRDERSGVVGTDAIDPAVVRRALAHLRRERFELAPLTDVLRRLGGEGPPLKRTIAFTMDDGYWEQAVIAGPLFAEFDCPITTFLTTGFVDGHMWFWHDRITYVLRHAFRRSAEVTFGGTQIALRLETEAALQHTYDELLTGAKALRGPELEAAVADLARACHVQIPESPPAAYAPMTWDHARMLEQDHMSFGPHSVAHPILSHESDDASEREISGSWARLTAELKHPVPVFCYPNGHRGDFGGREIATLRKLGFRAAVSSEWGYTSQAQFRRADEAYTIRRVGFPTSLARMVYLTAGAGRFREWLRRDHR